MPFFAGQAGLVFASSAIAHSLLRFISLRKDSSSDGLRRLMGGVVAGF